MMTQKHMKPVGRIVKGQRYVAVRPVHGGGVVYEDFTARHTKRVATHPLRPNIIIFTEEDFYR